MPYGLEHAKVIEAAPLSSEIVAWENRGAERKELPLMQYTNSRSRLRLCSTNVAVSGKSYEVVLELESEAFRGKGNLLGARNGVVIWAGKDGDRQVVHKGRQRQ